MALCVRRLRGAPGLGGRWRNGVRGAGGAAGRLCDKSGLRDVIWSPELNPSTRIPAPLRRPLPLTTIAVLPQVMQKGAQLPPSPNGRDKALWQLQEILQQDKGRPHPPKQVTPSQPCASSADLFPRESWHFNSTQLEGFRSLFEPGVCRVPYQAVLPSPGAQQGVLAFQLSKKVGASPAPGGNQPDREQHLALMHAKLRQELPKFLVKSLDYSLYRKDMEFVCNMLHIHTRGLVLYQLLLSLSRLLFLSYFSNTRVSVVKLTCHPETCSIQARWSVSGLPFHAMFLYIFRSDKSELYRTYDAHSTFYLAPDGLISLHKLDRMMPSQPLAVPKKTILAAALLALGLGESRPALNLLFSCKASSKL
ncbi:uncharacterized protein C6orf136 homolog [Pelodytes ibericus]